MDPNNNISFVLIDETVLTNGMRVLVAGIDTTQFERNPVMFYYHNDWQLPIGKWINIRKENGQLLADPEFDEEDDDKEVQRIIKKVKKGYIKMASAGLVDLELSDDPVLLIEDQTSFTVIHSRIREASIVPIGRNHNSLAFRLYDKEGNELVPGKKEDELKLSDFIVKPKIETKMSKNYLKILNLSDTATDEMIESAVQKLQADKVAAETRAADAEKNLNALQLADKQDKRRSFEAELDAAFKDGRLTEKPEGDKPTPVRERMLNLFDKDQEGTRAMLGAIQPAGARLKDLNLGDRSDKEFKELEAMDYSALDKSGKALLCRDKYPELYKEKFMAKFGKEPKMS